jgi:hypothetical protein
MSSFTDEEYIQRLFVAKDEVKPEILGRGPAVVRGSTYMQGPVQVGNDSQFPLGSIPTELGTVMIAETTNSDMKPIPFYSLFVKTYARIKSFLKVDTLISAKYIKAKIIVTEKLFAGTKNFKIDHPLDPKNKDLIYSCLEGPEIGVYIRGRITNRTEIELPIYWKELVDRNSVSVQLQPIGAHQNIIIKRWDEKKVYLQAQGGMPIDCFYHIYAERKDVPKLEVEVSKDGSII